MRVGRSLFDETKRARVRGSLFDETKRVRLRRSRLTPEVILLLLLLQKKRLDKGAAENLKLNFRPTFSSSMTEN